MGENRIMQTRFCVWNEVGGRIVEAVGGGRIRGLVFPSGEIGRIFGRVRLRRSKPKFFFGRRIFIFWNVIKFFPVRTKKVYCELEVGFHSLLSSPLIESLVVIIKVTWQLLHNYLLLLYRLSGDRGSSVVKLLCCKSVGRWFDPSWCHWNFSLT